MRALFDSRYRTFWVLFALTAVGFVVWLGVLVLLWKLLQGTALETDLWMLVEALSTAVAAAAVLSAGFVAYRELTEAAHNRYLSVADRLFEELNSPENVEARRWIFQNLPDFPKDGKLNLNDGDRDAMKRVLNSLDRVAFLTQAGWIPDETIMPWMNVMIVKVWYKLAPYVDFESRRRKEPDYYAHARGLAERCIAWRKKNVPDSEITWVKDAI